MLLLLLFWPAPMGQGATLIPTQSVWQYRKGTNEASTPVDAWRGVTFADSAWAAGPSPFYFGETIAGGTLLTNMLNRFSSIFLRKTFEISSPPAQVRNLQLRALCDDGYIAWINGVEVVRYNVPTGALAYNRLASTSVAEPVPFIVNALAPPSYLVAGKNVLAVQVFNSSLTSSDLQWEADLTSSEPDTTPPTMTSVEPAAGVIERLTEVIITFSEPVTGVQASDLFLGSQPAAAVQGSGARYTFSFPQPAFGPVELRWDADTLITDSAQNRFDPVAAGTTQYQVFDRTPPTIVEITPRPGLTVKSLTQIEVLFSEPMDGVDAADLTLNGIPATRVTGDLAGPYRFDYAPPVAGPASLSWAVNHGIQDRAKPANPFSGTDWTIEVNPNYVPPTLRINEFLASNVAAAGLKDEDGELQDWIEIYNQSAAPANLNGWSLSDDAEDPGRWIFPAITLNPGQFLIVFASGKDRKPTAPASRLHTNFKLNPAGEYLGLFSPESPRAPASEFKPAFPEQRHDYSYGYDPGGQLRHFRTLTPGAANGASVIGGLVPPAHVNIARGWYDAPFTLIISSTLADALHRYTTDGSEPTESNGKTYSTPLRITNSTVLRIASFKTNMLPSTSVTHTYLFTESILRQSNTPPGFPAGPTVNAGYPSDYEMDPEIVNSPLYSGIMKQALLSLPAVSVVCKVDDMFGVANGIYTHPTTRGPAWERPCSMEFIPSDAAEGFQINAGVQIQGNAAREPIKNPKHPMRVVFKGDYGPTRLNFPLFPDSPVSSFDTLILRADFNFGWLHWDPNQRIRAQRTRDSWMKDTMRAMGGLASHNRYVHMFINGLYWGLYDISERPDGGFAASYLGGEKEDYDIMNEGASVDGTITAYNVMLAINNLADPANYARMQQYLDMTQFIDYMLLHFYVGHNDWGQNKNWYAVRPKNGRRGFMYVPWDGEIVLDNINQNRVSSTDTPSGLHTKLVANAEYKLAFADRVQRHFFHDGTLTPASTTARWLKRAREVELPIVAESARWGDYRRDVHPYQNGPYQLYTRDNQWITEQNRLLTQYFPQRTGIVLTQLRAAGLYPNIAAPEPNQFGGSVQRGFALSFAAPDGVLYFTTDGSDPRSDSPGTAAPGAAVYAGNITLTNSVRVKARNLKQGAWSALTDLEFQVAQLGTPLRFTEIMYHPPDGDALEFVEVQNVGSTELDITGFSFRGVGFIFPVRTVVKPGQIAVAASAVSPATFAARYPGTVVAGYFTGSLANNGEQLDLLDREGRTVTSVDYRDSGAWPSLADGKGYSMEVLDPDGDPSDPANWVASAAVGGSPGQRPSPAPLGSIRLSEVMAVGSSQPGGDWIEVANLGGSDALIDGWILTDFGTNAFVFPQGTHIPAQSSIVVRCDGKTNEAGLHALFQLNSDGETVGLYDAAGKRADLVSYGPQAAGYSIARIESEIEWRLAKPTAGMANSGADLAPAGAVKINEWMANPLPGNDDWVELYNSDPSLPAALTGLSLATSNALFRLLRLTFLPPHGFFRLFADEQTGPGHLNFKLPGAGGAIALYDARGIELDRISFGLQTEGNSEGRLPDGSGPIVSLAGRASPGQSNELIGRQQLGLNEILTSGKARASWVELFNSGADPVDLSGFQLSLERDGGQSWTFPAGSSLPASQYLVVTFDPNVPASASIQADWQSGQALSASGGSVYLRNPRGQVIDAVHYGWQIHGLSVGRTGNSWQLLATPTPGQANSGGAELGSPIALRINEWETSAEHGDDWFELFNGGALPAALGGMYLSDEPSIGGARKFQIGPLSYVAAGGWVVWRADSSPDQAPDHVNFNLDQLGEALRLSTAEGIPVDAVDFGPQSSGVSEGRQMDGGPEISALAVVTRGYSNTAPPPDRDSDGDSLPDAWEIAHGTDPALADADKDPDGDGMTNRQEFLAGTDPRDSGSALKMSRITVGAGSVTLEFRALSNRTYSVLFKASVDAPVWQKLADVPVGEEDRQASVTDASPLETARFYRLATPAQP